MFGFLNSVSGTDSDYTVEIVHKTSILSQYSMNIGFFCSNEINQSN